MPSEQTLAELFTKGLLPIRQGALFRQALDPNSSPHLPDRVAGMLFGLATGDALGNTSEGMLPAERRRCHGGITNNDTIAAIVGAAVGALHGQQALPPRWLATLLGRTRAPADDGHVQELIAEVRRGCMLR